MHQPWSMRLTSGEHHQIAELKFECQAEPQAVHHQPGPGQDSRRMLLTQTQCLLLVCCRLLAGRSTGGSKLPERFADAGLWRWRRKFEHPVYMTTANDIGAPALINLLSGQEMLQCFICFCALDLFADELCACVVGLSVQTLCNICFPAMSPLLPQIAIATKLLYAVRCQASQPTNDASELAWHSRRVYQELHQE